MDISICFADFPTEPIGETTRDYRQLGIGYANLGALLMATGLGYDSDGGRAMAAAITSLMTGTAYKRSAELAGVVGPYAGYARNADAHKRVMRKHQAANDDVRTLDAMDSRRPQAAPPRRGPTCVKLGEKNGYRNAQASVLAPTGTIGFMMDCDTTGIEPDFSLVKFKKLVGGGSMQIVNQTIPRALRKLGYTERDRRGDRRVHRRATATSSTPPASSPSTTRSSTPRWAPARSQPMGHVRMMAAAQPFLSGAISKTVNLPETATVEEIEDVYLQGWKLGLKALAIYRDNCKVGQPLSDGGRRPRTTRPRPTRRCCRGQGREGRRVPPGPQAPAEVARSSQTTSFTVGGAEGYMTAGAYDDGELGEVFLKLGKQGSTLAGVMDAFSIAVSIGLQYGVPLETYVSKFTNLRFEPAGLTDDPDVRMAQSIMDYIFRRLALDYLPFEHPLGPGHLLRRASASATSRPAPTSPSRRPAPPPSPEDELESLQSVEPVETADAEAEESRPRTTHGRVDSADAAPSTPAPGGPHLRRAPREDHRHRRRLPALHDLRHEDAPRWLLLRLRGLRQHQRLQLMSSVRQCHERPGHERH